MKSHYGASTVSSFELIMAQSHNKMMHIINGNMSVLTSKVNLIQLNSSNANFCSKLDELAATIREQKAEIVIISESNMEKDNDKNVFKIIKIPYFQVRGQVYSPS